MSARESVEGQSSMDVLWCHHCGTYSFAHEWGSRYTACDECPVCDELFPGFEGGPLDARGATLDELIAAAWNREVVW